MVYLARSERRQLKLGGGRRIQRCGIIQGVGWERSAPTSHAIVVHGAGAHCTRRRAVGGVRPRLCVYLRRPTSGRQFPSGGRCPLEGRGCNSPQQRVGGYWVLAASSRTADRGGLADRPVDGALYRVAVLWGAGDKKVGWGGKEGWAPAVVAQSAILPDYGLVLVPSRGTRPRGRQTKCLRSPCFSPLWAAPPP